MRGLLISILVFAILAIPSLALAQNQPPVADAGADRTAYTGQTISLSGSAFDADGDPIVFWAWAVVQSPDGATWDFSGADTSSPLFAGFSPGDYVVSLFVGDSTGLFSGFDFATVMVRDNLPPVAVATANVSTITVGGTVCFDASQSYDPEGAPLRYTWDFADGSPALFDVVAPCHSFISAGTAAVVLRVVDERNAADTDVVAIEVLPPANHPPVASPTATPNSGDAPLYVQFKAHGSDADGDPLAYAWSFGDPLSADNNSTLENPTHIYDQNGFYHVALDVCDGIATINRSITIRVGRYGIDYLLGDIDFDGDVDFADVNEFTSAYLSENGDPDYNSDADLDQNNGFIDLYDFALLANDWGKTLP
jgi:PKD repeat protein